MQWPRGNKIPRANTFLCLVPLTSVWAFCLCYRPRTLKHSLHLFQCFPVLKSEHNSLRIEVLMRTIMGLFFFGFFFHNSQKKSDQSHHLLQEFWPILPAGAESLTNSHLFPQQVWPILSIPPAPEKILTNPACSWTFSDQSYHLPQTTYVVSDHNLPPAWI